MKQIIILILVLLGMIASQKGYSQTKDIEEIFEKYASNDDVDIVTISSGLLSLLARTDDNEILKGLDFIKIITISKNKNSFLLSKSLDQDFKTMIKEHNFINLIEVKDKDSKVDIFINADSSLLKDKKASDSENNEDLLLFIANDKSSYTCIYFKGLITEVLTDAILNNKISFISK